MSAWWLLMVPGALLYAAGALVTFGWMTCGGMYRLPSDYVWAAVWPVSRLRGVGWAIRWAIQRNFTTLIGGKRRFAVLTVPAQRPDVWLLKIGEEMAIRWENRHAGGES